MFCRNCGKELNENAQFCPNCGTPVVGSAVAPQKKQRKLSGIIIIALAALALIAVVSIFMPDFVAGYFNDDVPNRGNNADTVSQNSDDKTEADKSENDYVKDSSVNPDEHEFAANDPSTYIDTKDDSVSQSNIRFDTEFYSLELPDYWADLCVYDQWDIAPYGYGIAFYEKQSMEDFNGEGGFLFDIALYNDKDYMDFPDYTYLGELSIVRLARYDVVVSYPTDVQFSDAGQENYMKLSNDIAGILASFTPQPDVDCEYIPAT